MAIGADVRGNGKRMAGDGMAADGLSRFVFGAREMAGNTADVLLFVGQMHVVARALLMAPGAQCIGGGRNVRLLGMDCMAGHAGNAGLAVQAGLPLEQGACVSRAT